MTTSVFLERVDNYIIREANHNDYHSVLNINDNVFYGLDYLPPMYYIFLQLKNFKILVGDQDGELFSLIMAHFDESNPTLFTSMAHRISESKQGHGIFRQFEAACHGLLLSQFPQLSHRLVVADEKYKKPGGYTPLYRMHLLSCLTTRSLIHQGIGAFAQSTQVTTTIRQFTYQHAVEMLNNGQQLENFFSRYCTEYILAMTGCIEPVRITSKSGLKRVFAFSSSALITTDSTSLKGDSDKTSDINQPRGNITSLSFTYALPVRCGLFYAILFYGDDPYIAALHEIEHCRHLATIANEDNITLGLYLPIRLNCDRFTDTINPVFGKHERFMEALALSKFPLIRTSSE